MYKKLKQFIYRLLFPVIRIWKKLHWYVYIATNEEINLIVGAGPSQHKGWFSTDIVTLDVTNENQFQKYFKNKKIKKILAEHILEHLTNDELNLMVKNFKNYSSDDVNIRVAVPDGFHKDEQYIEKVKPGGKGEGAEEHYDLFNYKSLSALFEQHGFNSILVEYWDEKGNFHEGYTNDEFGYVKRSFLNDSRNSDGIPHYTSLIVDFRKK